MARILVVDDEADVLEYSCELLRALGHEVEAVSSAERALLRLQRHSFDLVLTDFSLPGLNGVELARAVKRQAPATLVGIVSGWESPDQKKEAATEQVVDFVLPKPFTLKELQRVVDAQLARRQ